MLKAKDWESQFFGKRIAQLIELGDLNDADLKQYDVIEYLTDSVSLLDSQKLTQLGFCWWEAQIDFKLTLTNVSAGEAKNVTEYDYNKHGDISRLVTGLFHESRFYHPPFDKACGRRFYQRWLENACNQSFDDLCLIVQSDDEPAGFVTLKFDLNNSTRIGIIGVQEQYQGQGLGSQLFNAAIDRSLKRGINNLQVKTQLSNYRSIEFYQRKGACIDKVEQRFLYLG